jgi:cytochrome b pre-mRNA-processing protein 3
MKISAVRASQLGNPRKERKLAGRLFAETTRRSRAPVFFTEFHVPDTMDGRFDLLTLHAWMVMDRLAGADVSLSQAFIDEVFLSFDEALRQVGTGDMGMTRRLKTLANAFYGRLEAYRQVKDVSGLTEAIGRNVYRGDEGRACDATALATYVCSARSYLAEAKIGQGELDFGPIPGG